MPDGSQMKRCDNHQLATLCLRRSWKDRGNTLTDALHRVFELDDKVQFTRTTFAVADK